MFPGRLAILITPSAPRPGGQNNGAVGYADRFNLRTLMVGTLAFVATAVGSLEVELWLLHCLTHLLQVHYALSADAKCLWSAKAGPGFNNLLFYQRIISAVASWPERDRNALIVWWNRCAVCCSSPELLFNTLADTEIVAWSSHASAVVFTRTRLTVLLHPVLQPPS